MTIRLAALASVASIVTGVATARGSDAQQVQLLNRVLEGARCQETHYNGRVCEFSIGKLNFWIMGVGGPATTIEFRHSDVEDEFYVVMHFGCIAVVPGNGHSGGYDRSYGVYVSPVTGNAYLTSDECRDANKRTAK